MLRASPTTRGAWRAVAANTSHPGHATCDRSHGWCVRHSQRTSVAWLHNPSSLQPLLNHTHACLAAEGCAVSPLESHASTTLQICRGLTRGGTPHVVPKPPQSAVGGSHTHTPRALTTCLSAAARAGRWVTVIARQGSHATLLLWGWVLQSMLSVMPPAVREHRRASCTPGHGERPCPTDVPRSACWSVHRPSRWVSPPNPAPCHPCGW